MVYFGLDLGKRQDYSALAAVEWTQRYLGRDLVTYEQQYQDILQVRGIERLPKRDALSGCGGACGGTGGSGG